MILLLCKLSQTNWFIFPSLVVWHDHLVIIEILSSFTTTRLIIKYLKSFTEYMR